MPAGCFFFCIQPNSHGKKRCVSASAQLRLRSSKSWPSCVIKERAIGCPGCGAAASRGRVLGTPRAPPPRARSGPELPGRRPVRRRRALARAAPTFARGRGEVPEARGPERRPRRRRNRSGPSRLRAPRTRRGRRARTPPPRRRAGLTPGQVPRRPLGEAGRAACSLRNRIGVCQRAGGLAAPRPRGGGGDPAPSAHRPGRPAPNKAARAPRPAVGAPPTRPPARPGGAAAVPEAGAGSGRGEPGGRRGRGGAEPSRPPPAPRPLRRAPRRPPSRGASARGSPTRSGRAKFTSPATPRAARPGGAPGPRGRPAAPEPGHLARRPAAPHRAREPRPAAAAPRPT